MSDASPSWITPEWPALMRVPLLRGRAFTAADREGAPKVVLVGATAAARLWPGADPIGRRISFGDTMRTVVGIVGDTRQEGVSQEPYAQAYVPFAQLPRRGMSVIVRTTGDPKVLVPAVTKVIRDLSSTQAVERPATLEERARTL